MTGSMYAAVSGLKAHMSALNVIGNNVANVNTLGYKTTRYTFNEALYTTQISGSNGTAQAGGRNPAQVGFGASIGTIDLDMSTKNYTPTGHNLDTMIDGDGFFLVGDKSSAGQTAVSLSDMTTLKGMNLTRLGNFEIDAQGYLVDGNGSVVWGCLEVGGTERKDDNGNIVTKWEEEPEGGSAVTVENLDGGWSGTNGHNIDTSEQPQTHTARVLSAIRMPNAWKVTKTDEDGSVSVSYEVAWPSYNEATKRTGKDENGKDIITTTEPEVKDATETGSPYEYKDGETSENTKAEFVRLEANTVSIDGKSGAISAMTSDGQLITLGYLALAKVTNPNGVTHVDGRYYQALDGAGEVTISTVKEAVEGVDSAGDTKLITGGLESSGTDLATEITNMITVQRGYQANTRIITVTDSMLEELVNMKR